MTRRTLFALLVASMTSTTAVAQGTNAPVEIKIGTLYASSGRFASISMPVHDGLKLWLEQKNAEGGVFVKVFNKKIPLKLIAYDDQSNNATAATLSRSKSPRRCRARQCATTPSSSISSKSRIIASVTKNESPDPVGTKAAL